MSDIFQVTWDNAADPMNPKNWPMKDKWIVTLIISLFLLATLMSSTIISPALPDIANSLDITSDVEIQTTISVFVLGYAFGPLFLAPLSEIGFAATKTQLITARLMAGIGGSAGLTIGGGLVGDVWKPEQRGRSLALYNFVPLLGPSFGPLMGVYIAQRASWRSSLFTLAIFETVLVILSFATFKETYAPTVLKRKAKALRKATGNFNLYTKHEKENPALLPKLKTRLSRPTKLLFTHPIIQILAIYGAYSFALLYIVHTTFPKLWTERYHESVSQSGLNFISIAIGFKIGAQVAGPITDRIWQHLRKKAAIMNPSPNGLEPVIIPEYRVPLMVPGALLVPVGLLIYGWYAQSHTQWIVPNIGIAIFSAGTTVGTHCQTAYVIDAYPDHTAPALAAIAVMKDFAGFGFPLFAPQMYKALDYGWGNTLIAGVAILLGVPMPWVLWNYGARIRAKSGAIRV